MKIGVISDTHGLLRPEALVALQGVDYILHAGDVGDAHILDALRKLAPVTAIRGNTDRSGPCAELPAEQYCTLSGTNIYMLHDVHALDLDPVAAGVCGSSFPDTPTRRCWKSGRVPCFSTRAQQVRADLACPSAWVCFGSMTERFVRSMCHCCSYTKPSGTKLLSHNP